MGAPHTCKSGARSECMVGMYIVQVVTAYIKSSASMASVPLGPRSPIQTCLKSSKGKSFRSSCSQARPTNTKVHARPAPRTTMTSVALPRPVPRAAASEIASTESPRHCFVRLMMAAPMPTPSLARSCPGRRSGDPGPSKGR
ncbi:unnamed protein product [Prorocentrum cordatum]|uniref:Uncharacterized protein n=1 Tax=Prorocentrum cordatum TaxID=2364126 RepID=A0ABN9PLU4_9DINO|nr:unnamed protein product [Polarella glacialis]